MRIWQIDTAGDPAGVDGVAHVVWPVSERLAAAGHDITIFVRSRPTPEALARAHAAGINVVEALHERLGVNVGPFAARLLRAKPDFVQVHVPLIPQMAAVVRLCRLFGVPWIYTTHGGLAPEILGLPRTARQRRLYTAILERPMIRDAAAVVYCSELERFQARAVVAPRGVEMVVEPPVAQAILEAPPWTPTHGPPTALYLGRFDVYQKAIDRLVRLFARLDGVELRLVGEAAPNDVAEVEKIRRSATPNVRFEPPCRGQAKIDLLRAATVYVQMSRFEGFPVSVAEALTIGTPTAVVRPLGIAPMIRDAGIGLCLSADINRAAVELREMLDAPARLDAYSKAARAYARRHFTLDAVAARYLALYEGLSG